LWETFKEFLSLIVFAKPSEKREFMVKALSSHPRKLAKVLSNGTYLTPLRLSNLDKKCLILRLFTEITPKNVVSGAILDLYPAVLVRLP
jgi:hypothetical protein